LSPISFDFNLPPKDAIDYLDGKGLKIGFNYEEIMHEAHHTSFTVAKVTRLDLLSDIHDSIIKAQRDGIPFEAWKKELAPTLKKYGWWGETTVIDSVTKEARDIYVGSRRLRTIFDTNMRVSYSIGRYKQMMGLPDSVYWRYSATLDSRSRPGHAAKNGIILHRDHPWWRTNYPPNDWNCRCKVRAYSMDDLKAKGWSVSEAAHENIASPDWAYDVGAGSRVGKLTKFDLDTSIDELPTISPNRSYEALSQDEIKQKFYDDLDISAGTVYIDKVGDPTLIDDALFTGWTGYNKLNDKKKVSRALFVDEFASLISDPDEIWLQYDDVRKKIVKKMLRFYKTPNGGKRALMALFEYQPDKTQGVTLYFVDGSGTVEGKRSEKLVYRRESM
jgi:SPP1 gp7 family putative phage head morphogenesis protein